MTMARSGPDARNSAWALLAGVLAALSGWLGLGLPLDDALSRWLAASTRPQPVQVLGIDAADPWPWPNARLAILLERLRAAGVRGVGLDLPLQSEADPDATGDAQLVRALLEGDVVLGVALESDPDGALLARLPPVGFADAARLGHVVLPRGRDGRVRQHLPRVLADDGIQWPSLPVALARPDASADDADHELGQRWQIVDGGGLPPALSAGDLVAGRIDPSRLHDRWVMVGLADPARQERLPGPRGVPPLFPVEQQARALAALLAGEAARPLPAAMQALLALLLAGGATYAGLSGKGPAWRVPVALLAGIGVALALSAGLLTRHLWFAPGTTVGVLVLGLAAWMGTALARQRRLRRRLPGMATRRRLQAAVQAVVVAGAPHALLLLEATPPGSDDRKADEACASRVAEMLRSRARRPDDVAAWLGGCRFALLLHGATATAAAAILEQVRAHASGLGLAVQGESHACGADGCTCLRRLAPYARAAR